MSVGQLRPPGSQHRAATDRAVRSLGLSGPPPHGLGAPSLSPRAGALRHARALAEMPRIGCDHLGEALVRADVEDGSPRARAGSRRRPSRGALSAAPPRRR
ncbi:unnamed protein product [Prorocentrum cordatum]|uniref:Uncharacterized protein n=1 Tax=Prorocentrum cordatum TaxID=2364126 RepID=A0ABN9VQW0_9DINO|nr:unnamed protein product [Polarella glacialis]